MDADPPHTGVKIPRLITADIERRVRAWMGRSALGYETKIALNDGLSGAFSADEARTVEPDVTAEMDGLVRFVGMVDRSPAKAAAVRAAPIDHSAWLHSGN